LPGQQIAGFIGNTALECGAAGIDSAKDRFRAVHDEMTRLSKEKITIDCISRSMGLGCKATG
jgi:hypothetical protein